MVVLWSLLFYDILFLPVPEAFQHKYQIGPMDLPTPAFYPSRKAEIDARLELIGTGDLSLIDKHWTAHYGVQCIGMDWERRALPQLLTVAACLGGTTLAAISAVFAKKYGSSRYCFVKI